MSTQKEENKFENSFPEEVTKTNEDEAATDQTEKTPQEIVFGIDLLHKMILKAVDDYDLLHNARLVNSHWNSVATKILQKRYDVTIRFAYYKVDISKYTFLCEEMSSEGEEYDSSGKSRRSNSLAALNDLMSNSLTDRFPVTSFTFEYGILDAPELQEFFNLHGSHVNLLNLKFPGDVGNKEDLSSGSFRRLLTNQVPNLKDLYLDLGNNCPFPAINEGSVFPSSHLPNLTFLDLQLSLDPSDHVLQLLQASPNLSRLKLVELTVPIIEYLIQSDRLSLLNQFISFNANPGNIAAYEKFADTTVKLRKIELKLKATYDQVENPSWNRIARCFEKILNFSSDSLKAVHWFTAGRLPVCTVPPLKNVVYLIFTDYIFSYNEYYARRLESSPTTSLFPPCTGSLAAIFPNVVHVVFEYYRLQDIWMHNGDIDDMHLEPLLTVKSLTVSSGIYKFSSEIIAMFVLLFPNVTNAKFKGIDNFPPVAKSIWKFLKLKKLNLEINAFAVENQYPDLDMAFTGLSMETVADVNDDLLWDHEIELMIKKKSSIANLKDLEILNIRFVDDRGRNRLKVWTQLMTQPSLSAFSMLPKMFVFIDIRAEEKQSYDQIKNCLKKMEQCSQISCEWTDA